MASVIAGVAQPSPVVQRQCFAALGAKADVIPQPVQKDLIDLIGHLLPLFVEFVFLYGAVEAPGKG